MIYELILIILLSLIPTSFSMLLDYALGQPGGEKPNHKAILFFYPYWLAKRRLKKAKVYTNLYKTFPNDAEFISARIEQEKQRTLGLYMIGKELFTYEFALGICIFCTGFWISLVSATFFYFLIHLKIICNLWLFFLIPIFSHLLIRKLQ